ncbi:MAG: hypothetical protein Salg2KO_10490 [Salibacteraceae bacterium]
MTRATLLLLFGLVGQLSLDAQIKPQLTQHLSNPSHLYPALSGWHGGTSVNANYRNQWPGIPATYVSYLIGFDHYSNKYNTAISTNFSHDRQNSGFYTSNRADISISPKIKLKNDLTIMPSASFHYLQNTIDWTRISLQATFDISDPLLTPNPSSPSTATFLSIGAGLALTYRDAFLAFQMNEIDNPNPVKGERIFLNREVSRNVNAIIGKVFTIGDFKVTPTITYWYYAEFQQLMVGVCGQYKRWSIGSRFAPYNFIGFSAGYDIADRIRIGYNYDVTTSRLATQTLGSHELSLRLLLRKKHVKTPFLSELPML